MSLTGQSKFIFPSLSKILSNSTKPHQGIRDHIEMFYNLKRKHVTNGTLSHVEFEKQ